MYTVIPIGLIPPTEADHAWLRDQGVLLPEQTGVSRYPTPHEVHLVLDNLPGYTVQYRIETGAFTAMVRNTSGQERADLRVHDFTATEEETDEPHLVSFDGGSPDLVTKILDRLSHYCGPFLMLTNGEDPVLVPVNADETAQR